eukprot:TRINITY_DN2666_c0_g1_i3.p1 TRINITY_DN2666_c0_g1~~TRINITY_DN2666_c0_g1_i3.p1  ORF type:complete len:166 (+),score=26.38 TRINITY_DN2666_c0_g1_i3:623-1120(+)
MKGKAEPKQKTPDQLYPILKEIPVNSKQWKKHHIQTMMETFRNTSSVHMTAVCNIPNSLATCKNIILQWNSYTESNPHIAFQMDPYYIIFSFDNLNGNVAPAGWGASVAAVRLKVGQPTANAINSQVYHVPTLNEAEHFGGFMVGRHPGLHFTIISTAAVVSDFY